MTTHHERKQKPSSKIGICHYHLCRKRTEVYMCKYCGEYFCKEHLHPKPPGMPRFRSTTPEDLVFMEEWHKPGGHPCTPYFDVWKAEQEKKKRKWDETLDKLLKSPLITKPKRPHIPKVELKEPSHELPKTHATKQTRRVSAFSKMKEWLNYRKYPHSYLRVGDLAKNLLCLIILTVAAFAIYVNIDFLNEIVIVFLKLGSLLLLILCLLSLRYIYKIAINLIGGFRGLKNSHKVITLLSLALILVLTVYGYHQSYKINKSIINLDYSYLNPILIKYEVNTSQLEKRIHELVNKEREKYNISSLEWDEKLASIARKHSQDMALNNYFSHINLKGEDPTARALKEGYSCYKDYGAYYTEGIAENIFLNNICSSITYISLIPIYDYNNLEEIAQSTVEGWMESLGHRSNILNINFDREGIGVAISSDGKVYITQDFC